MLTFNDPAVVMATNWGRSGDGWELVAATATVPPATFIFSHHHQLMSLQGTAERGPLQADLRPLNRLGKLVSILTAKSRLMPW